MRLGITEVDERKLAALCRLYRVRELSVFGSAARGEMRPDSDIDGSSNSFLRRNLGCSIMRG